MVRVLLCAVAIGWGAAAIASSRPEREQTYAKLEVFAKVLNYIQTHHVTGAPPDVLVDGAIEGMMAELDAHSEYLNAEAYRALLEEAPQPPVGIGVALGRGDGGVLEVETVLTDSPADEAGVLEGDRLVRVDRRPVDGASPEQVEQWLAGEEGTATAVEFERGSDRYRRKLRRVPLRPFFVRGRREPDGVVRLRIERFSADAPVDVIRVLDRAKAQGPIRGLVLDLRDNPGGLVEAAARVADLWLRSGTIVTTEARGRVVEKYVAHGYGTEADYPMAVLVDGGTASASEILAAALQETGRAQVVGSRTFGKGSVQTLIELEDGSALKLTVAHHFTPGHLSVQGVGVVPDHPLPPDASGDAAWIEARKIVVGQR